MVIIAPLLIVLVWWLWFRKTHDWRAILLYWFSGVLVTDLVGAGMILIFHRHVDAIISMLVFVMPVGGLAALAYGATKGRLNKGSGLFADD